MKRTTLRDFYGKIIGYIDTDEVSGNKTGRNFLQKIIGYYDSKQDVTKNFLGKIIYKGDMLASLIKESEK